MASDFRPTGIRSHWSRRSIREGLSTARALFAEPSPTVIKAVLHATGRIPTPHARMPHVDASEVAMKSALEAVALVGDG